MDVVSFDSLLMHFAEREGATIIIRGRARSPTSNTNIRWRHEPAAERPIETVFLMADVSLQPIASRLVKEIAITAATSPLRDPDPWPRKVRERVERDRAPGGLTRVPVEARGRSRSKYCSSCDRAGMYPHMRVKC
jgi:pantetheine-phosphate adenylyltransferase